ncbi:Na+/galactose cotransporter, partial [Corynebacterium glyciniphilum]|uniref:sodium:solute symporter family transporter n=1 Tax=Corynebacterium glyciniphilum TaxID=1404244 RepID=UPI00264CC20F
VIVLAYITLGGLSASIYTEVLQFFVIVAALAPLTVIGLNRVGGWGGLKEQVQDFQNHAWPAQELSGFNSPVLSVIGIVLGLGFVLSFGYWTTNFVEVQRAMASDSISAARKTPMIGSFVKLFVPFIVIVPGMIASVVVAAYSDGGDAAPNDAILYLMRDLLPTGLLGVAIAGLLASFMAGMAANISAFTTVFSYDIWQAYVVKDRKDGYYLKVGRWATVGATVIAVGTAMIANNFGNVMDYLQTLFGFFNAPLFATFLLGMFWKRMTPHAGWSGLVAGTAAAIIFWAFSLGEGPLVNLPGQGTAFVAAGLAFVVDILVSVIVTSFTAPKPDKELVGFVKSVTPKAMLEDPEEKTLPWYRRTVPLGMLALAVTVILNIVFH